MGWTLQQKPSRCFSGSLAARMRRLPWKTRHRETSGNYAPYCCARFVKPCHSALAPGQWSGRWSEKVGKLSKRLHSIWMEIWYRNVEHCLEEHKIQVIQPSLRNVWTEGFHINIFLPSVSHSLIGQMTLHRGWATKHCHCRNSSRKWNAVHLSFILAYTD